MVLMVAENTIHKDSTGHNTAGKNKPAPQTKKKPAVKVSDIPKYPAIDRDLSLIVDEGVRWAKIEECVKSKAVSELQEVRFVGIYRGKGIANGKKSVTLTLTFRDQDGTLTHEAVDGFQSEIVNGLSSSVAARALTTALPSLDARALGTVIEYLDSSGRVAVLNV